MRFFVPTIFAAAIGCAASAIATQAAPAPGACSILTTDEAKKFSEATKFFDVIPPEEEKLRTGSACSYADFIIQVDPFPFATIDAERSKPGQQFETVPGVGDLAYAHENTRIGAAEIYYRVGQHVVTIQMDIAMGQTYAATKPRLIGLARALAAKLK